MLPIALMRIRNIPETKINLNPYEMLYGRPFLSGDMLSDPETANLINYFTNLGQFQIALREYGNNILPMPASNAHLSKIQPGDQVLIKTWKEGSPADQLQPKWKGPFSVILTTPSAIKVMDIDRWIHLSRVKPAPPMESDSVSPPTKSFDYSCEPLEDLKLLFKKQPPSNDR